MNISIVIMKNKRPCIVYDEPFPEPIKHIEFDVETHELRFVFDSKTYPEFKMEYPMDYNLLPALVEKDTIYVSFSNGKLSTPIEEVPITFVNSSKFM